MNWFAGIAVLVLVGYLLDREIYFYEGVHLGPRVQAWLYNRWARQYDKGKRESQLRDGEMLAQPLLEATKDVQSPFILDFATGTGRLAHALISLPEFNGHIIALDLSHGMLEQAAKKIFPLERRFGDPSFRGRSAEGVKVEFLRHQTLPLPFPDASFDVVCALEVLELFPNMDEPLAEFARVLRPGGLLLTSRGTEESGRKIKVKSAASCTSLLAEAGFENIQITKWWKLFDRVIAQKKGSSVPVGSRSLQAVLQCSTCGKIKWERTQNILRCAGCGCELSVTGDGIVLN